MTHLRDTMLPEGRDSEMVPETPKKQTLFDRVVQPGKNFSASRTRAQDEAIFGLDSTLPS